MLLTISIVYIVDIENIAHLSIVYSVGHIETEVVTHEHF